MRENFISISALENSYRTRCFAWQFNYNGSHSHDICNVPKQAVLMTQWDSWLFPVNQNIDQLSIDVSVMNITEVHASYIQNHLELNENNLRVIDSCQN